VFRATSFVVTAFLLASLNIPQVYDLRDSPMSPSPAATTTNLASLGTVFLAAFQGPAAKNTRLKPQSELAIVRYVDGEFAHVLKPLPSVKKGFHVKAGQPVDEKALKQALANHGAAASPGDTIQITRIDFRATQIGVEINGGGKKRGRLRDHIQIGIGGATMPTVTTTDATPQGVQKAGAILILDFAGPVPDLSPDDVKRDLSGFLDFSKERSAAVNWVESLPPQYQQAIKDRRAAVGMDRDMVLAAMGRPDQKVRETEEGGKETEDWIYGTPPARTVFVTFSDDKVIRVKQYP
jgi:hypothetical protein